MTNLPFKSGVYVRLETDEYHHLVIHPTETLIDESGPIQEVFEIEGEDKTLRYLFQDLTEQEDLEWVEPSEIIALTDAPILAEYVTRDEDGVIGGLGRLWWHERYQIESVVEELLTGRSVRFQAALDDGAILENAR